MGRITTSEATAGSGGGDPGDAQCDSPNAGGTGRDSSAGGNRVFEHGQP